jgi:hypothetical protein
MGQRAIMASVPVEYTRSGYIYSPAWLMPR